jgi:CHASE2 domain-containing sensor protein
MKSASHHGETLWSHLKSATPLILIISGATFLMHQFGWLEPLETSALDFMLRLNKPVKPQYVRVVAIDDKDYESLFHKQSPLDPEKVRRLIETIVTLKPRVIGVDIDTTDSRGVRPQETTRIPVIWGQRPSRTGNVMVPLPVWGGRTTPALDGVYWHFRPSSRL